MSCEKIPNGFACVSSYAEAEVEWWRNNIKEYKEAFISYMNEKSKCGVEVATIECEAHIENAGVDCLDVPEYDADECMSNWSV